MMRILIVEDEARIAKRLVRMTQNFFEQNLGSLQVCDSLEKGLNYIENHTIDLLLLDLNLNGADGFKILESVVSRPFHTIIVSAYTDKAISAFAYGVLDFVPKPFNEERLGQAFKRLRNTTNQSTHDIKYLAIKKNGNVRLVDIEKLRYIKGAGIYSEIYLENGECELHDKSLESFEQLLPAHFERIHKSYIVAMQQAVKILVQPGSKYSLLLKNEEILPIGRSRYKELKKKML